MTRGSRFPVSVSLDSSPRPQDAPPARRASSAAILSGNQSVRLTVEGIVNVDSLALDAADIVSEPGLAMADATIFATASRHGAEIVAGDVDFDGLPSVRLIR
jgi:predicted nucleic acid-binding protein